MNESPACEKFGGIRMRSANNGGVGGENGGRGQTKQPTIGTVGVRVRVLPL